MTYANKNYRCDGTCKFISRKNKKIQEQNVHVYFDYLPDENQGTILHQAVYMALKLMSSLTHASN